jgi:hypothetical protein
VVLAAGGDIHVTLTSSSHLYVAQFTSVKYKIKTYTIEQKRKRTKVTFISTRDVGSALANPQVQFPALLKTNQR